MDKYVSSSFPNAIDFGFCIVNEINTKTIPITNHTKNDLYFSFEDTAFSFHPKEGKIPAKSTVNISVSIIPVEAIVIVANAILSVENEPERVIKLSAIGKYPYIALNSHKIDFETILIGKKVVKELIIKNQSQVPAKFEINPVEDDAFKDSAFAFDVTRAEIPAKSTFLIKCIYEPKIAFLDSVSHFTIECLGGNTLDFECKGSAAGYDVQLSTKTLDFGDVQLGNTTNRLLTVHNLNDIAVPFQFFNDKKNVFSFSVCEGIVKAKSTFRVIITFAPQSTMNYYERVYCLIPNLGVQYVDLVGSCYDLLIRPKPIKQKHIDLFRRRVIDGKYKKEDLVNVRNMGGNELSKKLINSTVLTKTQFGLDEKQEQISMIDQGGNGPTLIAPENPNQVVLHKELFQEMKSPNRLISINV